MTHEAAPARILTPLVIGIAALVVLAGAVNIALAPERILTWLLGMAFMPALMTGLHLLARRTGAISIGPRAAGGFRSGLVGAGMVLALAFGFAATDTLGWTGDGSGKIITLLVLPMIVIFADILSNRLSQVAEKDPDAGSDS